MRDVVFAIICVAIGYLLSLTPKHAPLLGATGTWDAAQMTWQ